MVAGGGYSLTTGNDGHAHGPPRTTPRQAFVSLLKGYVGPGCLSLPWAISQLGLGLGSVAVMVVAYWTSYNIWHLVEMKRHLQQQDTNDGDRDDVHNITYADVGAWLRGKRFARIVTWSICVQQMAVCTVFFSFIGTNLAASLQEQFHLTLSHVGVIAVAFPPILLLSWIPHLKWLSSILLVATITLLAGFGLLGVLVLEEWPHRPAMADLPSSLEWNSNIPLATCAILYSFEGICLILPIESSMQDSQAFGKVFVSAMTASAVLFVFVGAGCVLVFGPVSSGSLTAFLLDRYSSKSDDDENPWELDILYAANTLVSVAVLLTYPLQLYPSYELVGPWWHKISGGSSAPSHHREDVAVDGDQDDGEVSLSPRHRQETAQYVQAVSFEEDVDVDTDAPDTSPNASLNQLQDQIATNTQQTDGHDVQAQNSSPTSCIPDWTFPTPGDSIPLRSTLVAVTFLLAVAIPNVELLVSLAGALSGSMTGLILPPLLQLQYLKVLEGQASGEVSLTEQIESVPNDEEETIQQRQQQPRYKWKRIECFILLGLGTIVMIVGTGSALMDIIRYYWAS